MGHKDRAATGQDTVDKVEGTREGQRVVCLGWPRQGSAGTGQLVLLKWELSP